jgi:competence protein ComEA
MTTKSTLAAALILALATPVFAQTAAPAPAPSVTSKAVDAAGSLANKVLGTQPAATATKAPLININTAPPAALDALPQIGDARTKAIIAGRPYKSTAELVDRKIIPANAFDAIKDKIAVK